MRHTEGMGTEKQRADPGGLWDPVTTGRYSEMNENTCLAFGCLSVWIYPVQEPDRHWSLLLVGFLLYDDAQLKGISTWVSHFHVSGKKGRTPSQHWRGSTEARRGTPC